MKLIKINGNEYSREDLKKKPEKDLHIEVILAISEMQGCLKVIKTHIEVQDEANKVRFGFHEKLIYGSIFGIVITFGCLLIKTFT